MKKTCPGQSGINKTIMKKLPAVAIEKLRGIYNAALTAGYFPDKFKEAVIRLIPKHGKNHHKAENHRPISLLEVPGKIFERIINLRLRVHLEENQLYHPAQYGFRTGRGTTLAISIASEKIALDRQRTGYKLHRHPARH